MAEKRDRGPDRQALADEPSASEFPDLVGFERRLPEARLRRAAALATAGESEPVALPAVRQVPVGATPQRTAVQPRARRPRRGAVIAGILLLGITTGSVVAAIAVRPLGEWRGARGAAGPEGRPLQASATQPDMPPRDAAPRRDALGQRPVAPAAERALPTVSTLALDGMLLVAPKLGLTPSISPVPDLPRVDSMQIGVQSGGPMVRLAAAPPPERAFQARSTAPAEARVAGPDVAKARVFIHAPPSLPEEALSSAVARLEQAGFVAPGAARARVSIGRTNVRYFHSEDATLAEAAIAAIASEAETAEARDFTHFAPAPAGGTIEIWLAGSAPRVAPSPMVPARSVARVASEPVGRRGPAPAAGAQDGGWGGAGSDQGGGSGGGGTAGGGQGGGSSGGGSAGGGQGGGSSGGGGAGGGQGGGSGGGGSAGGGQGGGSSGGGSNGGGSDISVGAGASLGGGAGVSAEIGVGKGTGASVSAAGRSGGEE